MLLAREAAEGSLAVGGEERSQHPFCKDLGVGVGVQHRASPLPPRPSPLIYTNPFSLPHSPSPPPHPTPLSPLQQQIFHELVGECTTGETRRLLAEALTRAAPPSQRAVAGDAVWVAALAGWLQEHLGERTGVNEHVVMQLLGAAKVGAWVEGGGEEGGAGGGGCS